MLLFLKRGATSLVSDDAGDDLPSPYAITAHVDEILTNVVLEDLVRTT